MHVAAPAVALAVVAHALNRSSEGCSIQPAPALLLLAAEPLVPVSEVPVRVRRQVVLQAMWVRVIFEMRRRDVGHPQLRAFFSFNF